jgi:hypothetical protein
MLWKQKLHNWYKKDIFKYPKHITYNFIWRTSILNNEDNNIYKEEFIKETRLSNKQNYEIFKEYINKNDIKKNPYAIYFFNLSKDTILVIPIPQKNKSFAHIKQFVDNATLKHQQEFWKYVAKLCNILLKTHNQLYISTHGLAVQYFHLRISNKPKYYNNSKLLYN